MTMIKMTYDVGKERVLGVLQKSKKWLTPLELVDLTGITIRTLYTYLRRMKDDLLIAKRIDNRVITYSHTDQDKEKLLKLMNSNKYIKDTSIVDADSKPIESFI